MVNDPMVNQHMYPKLQNRTWQVLKSENILRLGPWLSVRQECVRLPNGTEIPTWFVLEFPDWINVIAVTKDGRMVMVDQYRHALGETHYELVAGVIDPGETPADAAARELKEETGLELKEIKDEIDGGYSAIGFSNERNITIFGVATGEFRKSTSDAEEIVPGWYTKEEIRELLRKEPFAARTQAYCYAWASCFISCVSEESQ